MRRIAIAGWLDPGPSGANRRLLGILRALPPLLQSGEEVVLLRQEGAPLDGIPPGIAVFHVDIPHAPPLRRVLRERRMLPRALEQLAAHVLEQGFLPVHARLPCPVSLTLHDLRDLTAHRRRPRSLARHVLRRSLARSAHVVVPSTFTARMLEEATGAGMPPTTVIPGGVDARFFAAEPHATLLPETGRRYLLHVGHLEPRKNLLMLLSAYAQMLQLADDDASAPDLVLAGRDLGLRRALEERALLLDLTGRVHFLGPVSDDRLVALYAGAVAVLVPSLYEGFGQTALEGLASGRPVLVSDCGALREVVADTAKILPAAATAAWASEMHELSRDAATNDSTKRAARRERARRFAWEAAAATTLEIWRELAQ